MGNQSYITELIKFPMIMLEHVMENSPRTVLRDKPAKVREKQRKSAVSALGHFLSWSVEMALFAATAVTHFQLTISQERERWIVFAREGHNSMEMF